MGRWGGLGNVTTRPGDTHAASARVKAAQGGGPGRPSWERPVFGAWQARFGSIPGPSLAVWP